MKLMLSPSHTLLLGALLYLVGAIILWWFWVRRGSLSKASTFADFANATVRAGDVEFRYHRSGCGPHLLLIHGLGANLYCWRFIVPLLNRHFTVTAIDLPGFGQSRAPLNARFGLDDQVPRLLALLDQLKIRRTFVMGNSMGGNLALWLALHHPERVQRVAVIAPATSNRLLRVPLSRWTLLARPTALLLTRQMMGWAHRRTVTNKTLVDLERIEETFRTYGGQHEAVKNLMLATEAIRDPRLPNALARIKPAVLVLWGSADLLVSRAVIDELAHVLPHAESAVHVGGGHHLQEDEPEWVTSRLVEFLTGKQDE